MLQEAKTDIGIGKAKGSATELPVDYPMAPKVQGSNLPEVCYWIGLEMVVMYFTNHTVIRRRKMWFDGCSGTCVKSFTVTVTVKHPALVILPNRLL